MKAPAPTPLHLPRTARAVVVFGGSFDPPHLWHIRAAAAARRWLERENPRLADRTWIVFVPAAQSPLKTHGPIAAAEHRIAMLRLATRNLQRSIIWTDEIDRPPGPSYTVETLRRLEQAIGRSMPIHLAIGADQAANFHRWKRWRTLARNYRPIVLLRPPIDTASKLIETLRSSGAWPAADLRSWESRVAPLRPRDYSSTAVRSRYSDTSRTVCAAVAGYIRRHGLYSDKPDRPR